MRFAFVANCVRPFSTFVKTKRSTAENALTWHFEWSHKNCSSRTTFVLAIALAAMLKINDWVGSNLACLSIELAWMWMTFWLNCCCDSNFRHPSIFHFNECWHLFEKKKTLLPCDKADICAKHVLIAVMMGEHCRCDCRVWRWGDSICHSKWVCRLWRRIHLHADVSLFKRSTTRSRFEKPQACKVFE